MKKALSATQSTKRAKKDLYGQIERVVIIASLRRVQGLSIRITSLLSKERKKCPKQYDERVDLLFFP